MKISKLLGINKSQHELDFFDFVVEQDTYKFFFFDPYYFSKSCDPFLQECHNYVSTFFIIAVLCVGAYLLERTAKRYGADFKTAFGIEQSAVLSAVTEAVKRYTLGGGSYNKSVVDQAFEVFDRMTEILKSDVHYKRTDGGAGVPVIAFDIKRIYDKFTKYRRDTNQRGEVLDFNMFRNQLEKKDYFIKRNHSVQLREDNEYGGGKFHTVKCYLLNAKKLSACADVSNILERCGIVCPEAPVYEQARFEELMPLRPTGTDGG